MRIKNTALSLVLVLGLVYLFVSGFRESRSDHMTVSALAGAVASGDFEDRRVQLAGQVVTGTIEWDQYHHRPEFTVTENGENMRVRYVGNALIPDTFKDDSPVVLEGHWRAAEGVFAAEVVMAKCPSKYEGQSYDNHTAVHEGS